MDYNLDITPEELKIFLDEAEEQIQHLTQGLLALEKSADASLLQDIFRAAHTIKGGAATLGRVRMTRLAHALETALNRLRNGELQPEPRLIDLMLQATDSLSALCRELAGENIGDLDLDPLRVTLENFIPSDLEVIEPTLEPELEEKSEPEQGLFSLTSEEQAEVSAALEAGLHFYRIKAELSPDAFLPAARLLQLYFALLPLGKILNSKPTIEQIEQEQAGFSITLLFATNKPEAEIEGILNSSTDIIDWQIEAISAARLGLNRQEENSETRPILSNESTPTPILANSVASIATASPASPLISIKGEPVSETISPMVTISSAPVLTSSVSVASSIAAEEQDATFEIKATAAAAANAAEGKTIRVNLAQLDRIMNLIGELVVNRTGLSHIAGKLEQSGSEPDLAAELNETLNYLSRITDDLQENMLKTRMTPVEKLFRRMPRLVRDLARQMGKEVEFILEGEQTELDRSIIEEISDPLIHLLRNAIDHGMESPEDRERIGKPRVGQIKLSASHRDGAVFIEVEDDGRGIAPEVIKRKAIEKGLITAEAATRLNRDEAIELIFLPGFSTAATVTEVSGRGVGMDIVRTNVGKVGGNLTVETVEGQGSRFILRLPLTLAIIQALLVTARGSHYAIPLSSVTETLRISPSEIQTAEGLPLVRVREKFLPLVALERALGFPPLAQPSANGSETSYNINTKNSKNDDNILATEDFRLNKSERRLFSQREKLFPVVAVRFDRFEVGLVVDGFLGEQEVVIKPLGWYVGEIPGLAGAMIEGDGQIALIIDVPSLLRATLKGDQAQLRASLSKL
jgi:two-component system chemotaxis sensor kinase CheA